MYCNACNLEMIRTVSREDDMTEDIISFQCPNCRDGYSTTQSQIDNPNDLISFYVTMKDELMKLSKEELIATLNEKIKRDEHKVPSLSWFNGFRR